MGNIVKNPFVLAAIVGISFLGGSLLNPSGGLISTASADEVVFDNQNSALPGSKLQFPNMDQLRGIIDHSVANPIIGSQFNKTTLSVSDVEMAIRKAQHVALALNTTEPMIDTVVTGQSNRLMVFQKFDSAGMPMNHHQEYSRPNAKSLASSIWDAIDLNPYPGE